MYSKTLLAMFLATPATVLALPTELEAIDSSLLFDRAIGSSWHSCTNIPLQAFVLPPLTLDHSMAQAAAKRLPAALPAAST